MTDELLDRAEEREVMAMRLPVSSMEDVLTTKLLALTEQEPNYASVLEVARTLREQIVWDEVRERTASSPFAKAFFTLIEELGILPEHARRLEVELAPGGPPVVGARDDRARLDDLDAVAEAELLDVARLRVLHLDLCRAAGIPRRNRGEVRERLLRALLDQLARDDRRQVARAEAAEAALDRDGGQPVAEQLASLRRRRPGRRSRAARGSRSDRRARR